jgi:glucose-6-phosphate 1-dehydrogenase
MELKENTVIVVLGASGDLAKKKTVSQQRHFPDTKAFR